MTSPTGSTSTAPLLPPATESSPAYQATGSTSIQPSSQALEAGGREQQATELDPRRGVKIVTAGMLMIIFAASSAAFAKSMDWGWDKGNESWGRNVALTSLFGGVILFCYGSYRVYQAEQAQGSRARSAGYATGRGYSNSFGNDYLTQSLIASSYSYTTPGT